jgi:hypothetical protein
MLALFMIGSIAQADWSYMCLGATHGCILAQHVGGLGDDGFYANLTDCEYRCPQIGKDLSWECADSGNCLVASQPPDGVKHFSTFTNCANAPGGKCFAPGSMTLSYVCQGAHFGCVPKQEKPDEITKFASIDDCEMKCHVVPSGMAFGCAGSRPTSCVLLAQAPNPQAHLFPGVESCNDWCNGAPGA